jgi:hypothetical protein
MKPDVVAALLERPRFARKYMPVAVAIAALFVSGTARADEASLKAEISELRAQIEALKTQVKELATQKTAPPATPSAPAAGSAASAPTAAAAAAPTTATAPAQPTQPAQGDLAARVERLEQTVSAQAETNSETTLYGYGEIAYSRPIHDSGGTTADLARAVLGWQHRFDDRTRMAAELEVEHAVASSTDKGEVEIEQFYAERQFNDKVGGRAGLFLIPIGFINEHHEPTQYYSVFRNTVETAIIPTTWREGGLAVYGGTDFGLKWNVGLTTGFNLANWDPSSSEGRDSPLGSIHQELSIASAKDLSGYLSVNYDGIPGWQFGGTYFTGKAGQGVADFPAQNARVTLWEGHIRWQPGPFDIAALYSRGTISDTEALNLTFIGQPTPVPQSFYGGYIQGAWRRAWTYKDYALTPFTRYEWVNTAASYASVPQGLGVPTGPTQEIWTIGADFYVTPSIVFKADYQQFRNNSPQNAFQLGFGLNF